MKNKGMGKEDEIKKEKGKYKGANNNELSEDYLSVEETRKPFASSLLLRKQSENPTSIISLLSIPCSFISLFLQSSYHFPYSSQSYETF
jgi:hypothetical protein